MEASTTILGMVRGNRIFVPDYQRAYSWDTSKENDSTRQVNVFLSDLENQVDSLRSGNTSPYYFGHFLFEKKSDGEYAIIDGQQRLTTIIIFLCVIFKLLNEKRETGLKDNESDLYEDMIVRRKKYRFDTVEYDRQLFRDYVVDGAIKNVAKFNSSSSRRFVNAYDYLTKQLEKKSLEDITDLLSVVTNASCTTHIVDGDAQAVQMFIFQNNRGKKPTNLEIIKALFMFKIYISGSDEAKYRIEEVKNRFAKIYSSISAIEDFVEEDDVLNYTLKVYYNSLWKDNPVGTINDELEKVDCLDFIDKFSLQLQNSFHDLEKIVDLYSKCPEIEYSLLFGHYDIVMPFLIKAINNNMDDGAQLGMAKELGNLMLRNAIVGTRADLRSRLNDAFTKLENNPASLINHINWMKTREDYWWGHWSNNNVERALKSNWYPSSHNLAKKILWLYENHLIDKGKPGYAKQLFSSIETPHLEHISPQTERDEKEASGYDVYDDDFRENYLLSLGNFLLLSGKHNISIGNKPFTEKRATYNQLLQQREIQDMTSETLKWTRNEIAKRQEKIVSFLIQSI